MKWLRLMGFFVIVAAVIGVVALRHRVLDAAATALRTLAVREVSSALHVPLALGDIRFSFAPLGLEVDAIALGLDGGIGRVTQIRVQLRPRLSLRQRRLVIDAEIDDPQLDVPALLVHLPSAAAGVTVEVPTLPRFRVRRVHVRNAVVQVTEPPDALQVSAPQVLGSLSADGPLGRLRVAARAETPALAQSGRRLVLAEARAAVGEASDGWHLRSLHVEGDGVRLDGSPRADAVELSGQLELSRLELFAEPLRSLEGTASIDANLSGALEDPVVHGTARVPALSYDQRAIGALDGEATLRLHEVAVDSVHLSAFGGDLTATGSLQFEQALPYRGRLHWEGLDPRAAQLALPNDVPALAASGSADIHGTLTPLLVVASGDGRVVAAVKGALPVTWRGDTTYADGGGTVSLRIEQGTANRAGVETTIGPAGQLNGSLELQVADPDALRGLLPLASLPNLRGSASATAQLAGSLSEPRLAGQLAARDVALAGVRVDRVAGRFSADRHQLRSDGIALVVGGGTASFGGVVAFDDTTENAWTLRVVNVDGGVVAAASSGLAGVSLPIAGGTLSADATARGAWPRARIDGTAGLERFWLGRERIEHTGVTLHAEAGRWKSDVTIRNRVGQQLDAHAEGQIGGALALDLGGTWTLTSLQSGEQAEMGGTLQLSASLRGMPAALNGTAEAHAYGLVLRGRPIGDLRVVAQVSRGRWDADATLLDGAFTAHAQVRPDAGLPFSLDGAWRDANLARLISDQLTARIESSGTLHAAGRLTAVEQVEATLQATTLRVAEGETAMTASPLTIVCRRGTCVLQRVSLQGPNSTLNAVGEMSFDGRLRVEVEGAGNLALLELIGPPIESARGHYTVDVTLVRSASGLSVSGNLAFDRFGIDAGLPIAVTKAQGKLSLVGSTIRIDELSGRVGTGTFRVTGAVDLLHGPNIGWELKDVGAVPTPSLEIELSGQGTVTGAWISLLVAGDVHVHRALYDRDLELTDFLPSFNRALANAPREAGVNEVRLDLHIVAPGQLFVENNLAKLEGRADLRLSGTASHPVLSGRVEGLDGEVRFRGRTFDLEGATVDFRPDLGLAAALNIGAESVIDTPDATYTVGVRVTGTTQNPRVALISDDPSLSQTDIATLIAVGKTTTQLRTGSGGFSAYDALSFVPRQITEGVQGGAKQLLPIDRIEFESTYSRTTGAFEPQLKIGKDLTDNLSVAVGQTFGVASRTSVEADYKLGPRVSIPLLWESQTETEAGALGGGIKLRYEFWRITPFTLLSGLR